MTKQTDSKSFYIAMILGIAIEQFVCKTAYMLFPDAPSQLGSRIAEIIMLMVGFYFWKKTQFVQPGLGLKLSSVNKKNIVFYLVVLSATSLGVLFLARIIGQQFIPGMIQRPYFGLYLNITHRIYYPIVVIIQEILSKAVLQYGIEKTLPEDKWKLAVIISSAVFGMLHVHTSALLMLGAFALALVSGIYYHYQKNIWAIIVVHFIFGFFARSFGLVA